MKDTRPYERIQHSFWVGNKILEYYGREAWKVWLLEVAECYEGPRRPNPAHRLLWEATKV